MSCGSVKRKRSGLIRLDMAGPLSFTESLDEVVQDGDHLTLRLVGRLIRSALPIATLDRGHAPRVGVPRSAAYTTADAAVAPVDRVPQVAGLQRLDVPALMSALAEDQQPEGGQTILGARVGAPLDRAGEGVRVAAPLGQARLVLTLHRALDRLGHLPQRRGHLTAQTLVPLGADLGRKLP